ncbi:hypothetical protein C2E31_24780 [Rhodopirellula baltica]|nr:hypothetical protein C2E31_24780 [Rhodopirellula baltica]
MNEAVELNRSSSRPLTSSCDCLFLLMAGIRSFFSFRRAWSGWPIVGAGSFLGFSLVFVRLV